ncbi:PAS domain S-box-containing protein [Chitinophaga costaii]|uniref:histidine kinase n=1 Tax=Chitinophaga costaii TaxID=1335309 RepID=A0A1C4ASE0_9BACT|nr:PAS domain S-box protein [Chitinophaga costaii]PUZ26726.1 PAS domain S-box protein [Chitinophaga costaii]SCB97484.1 PAS domain S-box-containing protein [Chitinophaga costaii]
MKQLKRPIILIIAIALLCITTFVGYTYKANRKMAEASEWAFHTGQALDHINNVRMYANRLELDFLGYLRSQDSSYLLQKRMPDSLHLAAALASLDTLLAQEPLQKTALDTLYQLLGRQNSFQQQQLSAVSIPDSAAIPEWQRSEPLLSAISTHVQRMYDRQMQIQEQQLATRSSYAARLYQSGITGGIVLSIILVMALLRINFIMHQLRTTRVALHDHGQLYQQLVEASGSLMYLTNLKGYFEYISPQALALCGFAPEELLERHYSLLLTPETFQELRAFYEEQVGRKSPITNREFEIITKSGQKKWVEQQITLRYQQGKVIGYQGLVKDIHEKKMLQLAMEAAHQERENLQYLMQAILQHTPTFVFIKDLQGKYLLVNKEFEKVSGLAAHEILGHTDQEITQPIEALKWAASDQKVIDFREPVKMLGSLERNGQTYQYLVTKYPLFNANNEVYGIGTTGVDITDHVSRENELLEARTKAEEARRLQEIFLVNMSHALRTPINSITGMAYLLHKTVLSETQKEYTEAITASTEKLTLLINDIAAISNIHAGRLQLEKGPLNLPLLLQKSMAAVRPLAETKSLNLYCDLDENIPTHLYGDALRLGQVFGALLENAVKFTAVGNVELTAMLLEEKDTAVRIGITVTDTGIGIEPGQQENIFKTYEHTNPETSLYFAGAGVGLAICREILHLHHGSIAIKNRPGPGTTFYVELPLEKYNVPDTPRQALTGQSLEGKKILLAEDNPINQKVVRYTLQQSGAQVDVASDGLTAMQMMMQKTYDCILLDLQMPEMNGYEAIAALRRLGFTTPSIATTASTQHEAAEKCMAAGFNAYIAKPFSPDELVYKILDLLEVQAIAAPTASPTPPLVDFEYLFNITQKDKPYLSELLNTFTTTAPENLDKISQAMEKEDWEEVKFWTHRMQASLAVVRIASLNRLLLELEQDIEKPSPNMAQKKLQSARQLYEKAATLIAAMQNTL